MIINKIIFLKLFFMIFALLFSVLILYFVNPIYSIFSLIGSLICSIFVLLLSDIEYLSYIYLIVYVGAIAILFLFVIMMLNIKYQEKKIGVDMFKCLHTLVILKFAYFFLLNIDQIKNFWWLSSDFFYSIFQDKIIENVLFIRTIDDLNKRPDIFEIGLYLYTDYFFNFIVIGYILLITMVITLILASNKKK